jgi:hypothetical protein
MKARPRVFQCYRLAGAEALLKKIDPHTDHFFGFAGLPYRFAGDVLPVHAKDLRCEFIARHVNDLAIHQIGNSAHHPGAVEESAENCFALLQSVFGPFQLGNVPDRNRAPGDLTVGVANGGCGEQDEGARSVDALDLHRLVENSFSLHGAHHVFAHCPDVWPRRGDGVHENNIPGGIGHEDCIADAVNCGPEPLEFLVIFQLGNACAKSPNFSLEGQLRRRSRAHDGTP